MPTRPKSSIATLALLVATAALASWLLAALAEGFGRSGAASLGASLTVAAIFVSGIGMGLVCRRNAIRTLVPIGLTCVLCRGLVGLTGGQIGPAFLVFVALLGLSTLVIASLVPPGDLAQPPSWLVEVGEAIAAALIGFLLAMLTLIALGLVSVLVLNLFNR